MKRSASNKGDKSNQEGTSATKDSNCESAVQQFPSAKIGERLAPPTGQAATTEKELRVLRAEYAKVTGRHCRGPYASDSHYLIRRIQEGGEDNARMNKVGGKPLTSQSGKRKRWSLELSQLELLRQEYARVTGHTCRGVMSSSPEYLSRRIVEAKKKNNQMQESLKQGPQMVPPNFGSSTHAFPTMPGLTGGESFSSSSSSAKAAPSEYVRPSRAKHDPGRNDVQPELTLNTYDRPVPKNCEHLLCNECYKESGKLIKHRGPHAKIRPARLKNNYWRKKIQHEQQQQQRKLQQQQQQQQQQQHHHHHHYQHPHQGLQGHTQQYHPQQRHYPPQQRHYPPQQRHYQQQQYHQQQQQVNWHNGGRYNMPAMHHPNGQSSQRQQQVVHNTMCYECSSTGNLLRCKTCTLAYHPSCLKPPLREAPSAWQCPMCTEQKVQFDMQSDVVQPHMGQMMMLQPTQPMQPAQQQPAQAPPPQRQPSPPLPPSTQASQPSTLGSDEYEVVITL